MNKLNYSHDGFVPVKIIGGAGGTRTPYLFNAIEALSQMSYSPTQMHNVLNIAKATAYINARLLHQVN